MGSVPHFRDPAEWSDRDIQSPHAPEGHCHVCAVENPDGLTIRDSDGTAQYRVCDDCTPAVENALSNLRLDYLRNQS